MKRFGIVLLILAVGVSIFIWHTKAKQHLFIRGWGMVTSADNQGLRGLEMTIENNGFARLRLEKVYINENEIPEVAELGIGRTNAMVQMLTPSENEKNGVSFHKLDEFYIKPNLTPKQIENLSPQDKEIIKHYGIWIQNFGKPINKITIQYRYLGIPFTYQKNFNNN